MLLGLVCGEAIDGILPSAATGRQFAPRLTTYWRDVCVCVYGEKAERMRSGTTDCLIHGRKEETRYREDLDL